jgi:hypothetical protein
LGFRTSLAEAASRKGDHRRAEQACLTEIFLEREVLQTAVFRRGAVSGCRNLARRRGGEAMGEYSELEDPVAVILTLQRYREKLSSQVGSSHSQALAC